MRSDCVCKQAWPGSHRCGNGSRQRLMARGARGSLCDAEKHHTVDDICTMTSGASNVTPLQRSLSRTSPLCFRTSSLWCDRCCAMRSSMRCSSAASGRGGITSLPGAAFPQQNRLKR